MKKEFFCLLSILFVFTTASAQDFSAYQKAMMIHGKDTLRYRVLFPENFQPKQKYPVVVFLHGSGECGRDNEAQLAHGADVFLKSDVGQKYPAIVIFPQCSEDGCWCYYVEDTSTKPSILTFPPRTEALPAEQMLKR